MVKAERAKGAPPRPQALPVLFDSIPADLAALDQWVLWRYEWRDGKWTKRPYAVGGGPASSTDPASWAPFAEVKAAYLAGGWDGVGLVHLPENELTGMDVDHCRDPATGALTERAAAAVKALDTYAEASPSGTGVRAYAYARKPGHECKRGGWELYDGLTAEGKPGGRYLTVTGQALPGPPKAINHRQEQVEALYREVFGDPDPAAAGPSANGARHAGDDEIIERLARAKNGRKFLALWGGDLGAYEGDDSRADEALCCLIAYYTKDPAQVERIFSRSGLARREKWRDRPDYRRRTVAAALRLVTEQCQPPSAERQRADAIEELPIPEPQPWPALGEDAYHGLAGEVLRAIEPHTEADPVAVLAQLLAAFGNAVGRGPRYRADGAFHHGNLFVMLIGKTAHARKGTAWERCREAMELAAPDWLEANVRGGLSTGEGLIYHVRDPEVEDKRVLVIETEFARVLSVMERRADTLSAVLRQAWDGSHLSTMTRNEPMRATGAHVSIVGHITEPDLREHLGETEVLNGFGNRFLWLLTRRSKRLPDGGKDVDLAGLGARLADAIAWASGAARLTRSEGAKRLWHEAYEDLTADRTGLYGGIVARGAPQVLRLSILSALLDKTATIEECHLRAALALWGYADQSARILFGRERDDPLPERVLARLVEAGPNGLTRSQVRDAFDRNVASEKIVEALAALRDSGRAVPQKETNTGGRPRERWRAVRAVGP
jgi:hypothetical protein